MVLRAEVFQAVPVRCSLEEKAALLRVRACSVHTASVVVRPCLPSNIPVRVTRWLLVFSTTRVSFGSIMCQSDWASGLEQPIAQMHAWTERVSAIIVSSVKTVLVEEAANPLIVHCIHRGVRVGARSI